MTVYLNDWAEGGRDEMISNFGIDKAALEGAEILIASYTYEDYEGSAFVLFRRDGKLYEIVASHCSCYGLSESNYSGDTTTQWQPAETTLEAQKQFLTQRGYVLNGIHEPMQQLLDRLTNEATPDDMFEIPGIEQTVAEAASELLRSERKADSEHQKSLDQQSEAMFGA